MGGGGDYFTVTVTGKEVVAAAVAEEEQRWLPLSNLDLILPPVDVSVFFSYKKSNSDDHDLNSFGYDKLM